VLAGEYAWGTTSITRPHDLSNAGANNEIASDSGANCVYSNSGDINGALRSGFAATSGTVTRGATGASYYGIMELSGNIFEKLVSVMGSQTDTTVSTFTGLNGNGSLSLSGNANVDYWPGNNGTNGVNGEVTGVSGSGYRGGRWYAGAELACVSNRYSAAYSVKIVYGIGGRCVRTQ